MWDPCCTPAPRVADCMYVCMYVYIQSTRIYFCYIICASHVTFSFESSIFVLFSMIMALRKKRVRTLHDRLKIIHGVEKNPGEKRVDIAKCFGLPASTLNTIRQEERYPRTNTEMW
jgi:peroxiredoxin family protein